ncbi:MAG TPA: DUF2062 domain-containing protein [Terracidiphilus sp.]|nr:DUF2062 domain-containing protein [Terracidiphilus sp.]
MHVDVPTWKAVRERAALWLLEGISPERLALTLALGFVLGCFPLVGVPTALCAVLAIVFRLNLPAIQAANYAAMPFQLALVAPFVKLGARLTPMIARPALDLGLLAHSPIAVLIHSPSQVLVPIAIMAAQALLAWILLAIPVVVLLTAMLVRVLRRVPALAETRS